jgi:hypothetical protein
MLAFAISAAAQRNMIEVPSSEIVEKQKIFIQGQAIVSKEELATSAIATYGLGHDLEIGLTLHQFVFKKSKGIEINQETPEQNPDFLINVQKGFTITRNLKLGLGTRSGLNAVKTNDDLSFVNFDYINSQYTFGKSEHKFVAGIYYANTAYAGEGTNFGIMAGVDISLSEKIHFVSDFISGRNALSVINAGLQVSLPKEWKLTTGAQLPAPGSDNEYGAILQISKN